MKKIFISYSRDDIAIAQSVSKTAERQGYKSFVDFDTLTIIGNFAKQITNYIKDSDFVLFIVSKVSLDSQWNRREVEFAIQQGKTIIPILYNISEADIMTTWLWNYIHKIEWINWDKYGEINLIRFLTKYQEPMPCVSSITKQDRNTQSSNSKKWVKGGMKGCLWSFLAILVFVFAWGLFMVDSTNMSSPVDEDVCSEPTTTTSTPDRINETGNILNDSLSSDTIIIEEISQGKLQQQIHPKIMTCQERISTGVEVGIIIFVLLLAIVGGLFYRFKFRRISIKFVADDNCELYVDNNKMAMLYANKVVPIKLKKGTYYITFKPINKSIHEKSLSYAVKQSNGLINIIFDKYKGDSAHKTIKCFIAGSTKLESERDTLRSAIAQTHNHWTDKNVEILSYTFEDFERQVVEGGQQKFYDDFITNDATIAVFIISGEIGEFTIREFDKALNAYKSGKHPQILVFNNEHAAYHEQAETLKEMVTLEKQYWVDYDSLRTLKLQFMSTLNWLLIDSIYN